MLFGNKSINGFYISTDNVGIFIILFFILIVLLQIKLQQKVNQLFREMFQEGILKTIS